MFMKIPFINSTMDIKCLLLCLMIKHVGTEFTLSRRHPPPCEIRGTNLVEQFFNIIFAEFHHSPPSCVCVQMCPDHPTYCYPNGCFKKADKKKETPVSRIQQEGAKMFLVDSEKGFLADLMPKTVSITPVIPDTTDRLLKSSLIGFSNPYKDILFKYKKIPKLEMKYNLREQVKHTKERKTEIDVSKTRWPTNKQLNRQLYKVNHQRSSHYFTSVIPETNKAEAAKYFKRYLTKRENQNRLDIGSLYLYNDVSNFSMDPLIDNLIERALAGVNGTLGSNISNSNETKYEDNKGDSRQMAEGEIMNSIIDYVPIDISRSSDSLKNVVHRNNSEDEDAIKSLAVVDMSKNHYKNSVAVMNYTTAKTYFEIITKLSEDIEQQNNASLAAVEQLMGKHFDDIPKENIPNIFSLQNSTNTSSISEIVQSEYKTKLKSPEGITKTTTKQAPESSRKEFMPIINGQVRKSKQRVLRKLRNSKLN